MIIVCENFNKRLDKAWTRLQSAIINHLEGISQHDCDKRCVELVERMAEAVEQILNKWVG